jgi:(1->4)-alpha-D-glucan 1-alpha-D-glucosylmutase
VHRVVGSLIEVGKLDGLRVDHIDGLRAPGRYLDRLRTLAPHAYIVVEKILESGEQLPPSWPVDGTTGYDFLNRVGGLFVDARAEATLTQGYAAFTGFVTEPEEIKRAAKMSLMRTELATDVERLTGLLAALCERDLDHRDHTRAELRAALRETIAAFGVYRTYFCADPTPARAQDAEIVRSALRAAEARRTDIDPRLFEWLGELLEMRHEGSPERDFALRFQQLTGSVKAKGIEDTLFFSYNRFVAANEVGGDPFTISQPVASFHDAIAAAQRSWPRALLATSTHDTKRSEDVRARLALLSELPEQWLDAVREWSATNERHRTRVLPDRNIEYAFYQTLVGAWPIDHERVSGVMRKSAREAKDFTSWTDPDEDYEAALEAFVAGALDDDDFLTAVEAFVAPLIDLGRVNSLAQTLIKLTVPGVPDIYQGTELWDLSLVDPDNRRPVDYAGRRKMLAEVDGASPEQIWERRDDGAPKLWLIHKVLELRNRLSHCFASGARYTPLGAAGDRADHVVAFLRGDNLAVVVPRLVVGLDGEWRRTTVELPPGSWRDELSGELVSSGPVALSALTQRFPVALLTRA